MDTEVIPGINAKRRQFTLSKYRINFNQRVVMDGLDWMWARLIREDDGQWRAVSAVPDIDGQRFPTSEDAFNYVKFIAATRYEME